MTAAVGASLAIVETAAEGPLARDWWPNEPLRFASEDFEPLLGSARRDDALLDGGPAVEDGLSAKAVAGHPDWLGFNFPSWWNGVYGSPAADASLVELRNIGSNAVAFTPTHFVASGHGSDIFSNQQTEDDANLLAAMAQARSQGLDVFLKPHIDIADWSASRLQLVPDDPAAFFADYTDLMVHYATLAEQNGVELFSIGTELASITGSAYTGYWNTLIDEVRDVYSGKLTYAANWGEEEQVGFWQKLDYVGTDFYAPLTEIANPTRAQLLSALNDAPANGFTADLYDGKAPLRYYQDLSEALGKPLLFTEIGWTSVNGANMQWSNTVANPGLDPQEQADLYGAFLDSLGRSENQFVDGVFFWAWGPQVNPADPYSMSIENNPARGVVEDSFEHWTGTEGPEPVAFAEYGTKIGVKNTPVTIQLEHDFIDPVVIVSAVTYNGSDPVDVRITNIQDDRFTLRVQEPEHLDDVHAGEKVSWMVVERGTWQLANGAHVEAGTREVPATKAWTWVDLADGFRTTPVMLSQVQTNRDPTWVLMRERNVNSDHFEFVMQREEKLTAAHGAEKVGYLAIEPSVGPINGHAMWAYGQFGATDQWSHLDFGGRFATAPSLLGSLSTTNDLDPAVVRFNRLTASGVDFMAQEDASKDAERVHGAEGLAFLAMEGHGVLTGYVWDPAA